MMEEESSAKSEISPSQEQLSNAKDQPVGRDLQIIRRYRYSSCVLALKLLPFPTQRLFVLSSDGPSLRTDSSF